MRRNRSQTAKRRSHHALKGTRVATCECGALRLPHRACPSCGKYNGRVVVDVVAAQAREARRAKRREKEMRESGRSTGSEEASAGQAKEKAKETERASVPGR